MSDGLSEAVKPIMGHLVVGACIFGLGGLLMSRNFTAEGSGLRFSTDDDEYCLSRLRQHYVERVRRLRETSAKALAQLESGELSDAAKASITRELVGRYVSPASHDTLCGKDIVIYNGPGNLKGDEKPAILARDEWNEISSNWGRALAVAGVKDCVDTYRIQMEYSARGRPQAAVPDAWARCSDRCAFIK